MAPKRRINPIKKREKRAKIAAAVGGVLFLAVAAYEVPSLMKMMNQKPPASAHSSATASSPVGSAGLPDVAAVDGGASDGSALANTDPPPASDGAQLVSFSVFQMKNPFAPQVKTAAPAASAPTTAERPGADAPSKEKTGTTTTPALPRGATIVPSAGGAGATTTTETTAAAQHTVAISVNGQVSHVGAQGTFPSAAPVFRLVAFTSGSADIGIVGGSLASGEVALTLHVGHAVTLQNTTDDKTYKLELLSTH